jgi:hypothetical protein
MEVGHFVVFTLKKIFYFRFFSRYKGLDDFLGIKSKLVLKSMLNLILCYRFSLPNALKNMFIVPGKRIKEILSLICTF